ncbi:uncharacterized mitochondrial protein AtMg00810-like [Nicotiana tomentosiformis]|uniref:uncharacterized mitochondrial protein AtMg00810-like n=1 Tax=Nicotiana tomentosiformis TaxID=4098 RepID=UPI00388CA6DF
MPAPVAPPPAQPAIGGGQAARGRGQAIKGGGQLARGRLRGRARLEAESSDVVITGIVPVFHRDAKRFIRLVTTKEIWEVVGKTFYDGSDETCLFELNQKSFTTKQNGRPLSTFYNELVEIFQEIDHRMVALKLVGYRQSNPDKTLFIKSEGGKIIALIVYVDDVVLTSNDTEEIKKLQKYLVTMFEMKDLGQLQYFLGIEVSRSNLGISLCQRKYVLDLLTETGMLTCKSVETPMEMHHLLEISSDQSLVDIGRYQRLVEKLIYLTYTRPDIAYIVSVVRQFMHTPNEEHMRAVYRILRYLKGAPGKGLFYSKNETSTIEGYTDVDWAGDRSTKKSTSGYFMFVEGNLVTWRSKKQKVVARSSAEAEFRAIQIAQNPVQHDLTKHVEIYRHFIKEKLDQKIIQFPFVKSEG